MKNIILVIWALLLGGCASTMRATSECSYIPGFEDSWRTEKPSASCKFYLESPINDVTEAETFAQSFRLMFNSLPDMKGVAKPVVIETVVSK